ncbi:hypothetical protein HPB51_025651 [Rhipicephalus microplus]|uniref:Uncharacterized protein n=1 Tax=Rhipicephalus microplus TaxID=6941 RepID=A0A9J6DKA9_RHIMP|nr:hypothetical protein HPB51_025651 [Rhipicephalus microplus]
MLDGAAVIIDGVDFRPKEFEEEHGWRSTAVKKNSRRTNASATERATACGDNARNHFSAATKYRNLKNKVIKSSRMPRLPREHWKITLRPRVGLDVEKVGSARLGRHCIHAHRSGYRLPECNAKYCSS